VYQQGHGKITQICIISKDKRKTGRRADENHAAPGICHRRGPGNAKAGTDRWFPAGSPCGWNVSRVKFYEAAVKATNGDLAREAVSVMETRFS
jgi:hypothetical protein